LLRYINDGSLIRDSATNDREPVVRLGAIQQLIAQNIETEECWDLIRTAALLDGDSGVRRGVLEHVAAQRKHSSKTWSLIRAALQEDREPDVRIAAVELLATGQKENPETWHLLREATQNDRDLSVRATALAFIANEEQDFAFVKKIFAEISVLEKDSYSRQRHFTMVASKIVNDDLQWRLLSRDLDYQLPFLDLTRALSLEQVKKTAGRLRKTEAEVCGLYEALADTLATNLGVELKLEWNK
jgi:hypothetical protein